MADFRFKIQGSASPFLIQLSAGTTPVCETVFEYTGSTASSFDPLKAYTCAILSELEHCTTYNMRITDCVGNIYPTGSTISFTTPDSPIPIIIVKNVSLLSGGTDGSVDCFNVLTAPKYIDVTPPLTGAEALDICLCIDSCNGASDSASVNVYKKLSGTGTYSLVGSVSSNDDCEFSVCMQTGDEICYDLNASVEHAAGLQCTSIACACLDMVNVTYSGSHSISTGNTQIRVIERCATTTTTTVPPIGTLSVLPTSILAPNVFTKKGIAVTAPAGLSWVASTSESWINIPGGTGTGSANFAISIAAYAGSVREGNIRIESTEPTAYVNISQGVI